MFHIDYLRLYQRELENELRPTDNQIVNCCNAFVVAVVANYLKSPTDPTPCPGLLIEPKYIRRIGKNENSELLNTVDAFKIIINKHVNYFFCLS